MDWISDKELNRLRAILAPSVLDEPEAPVSFDRPARLDSGVTFGRRFKVLGELGAGGMSRVYRAWDHEIGAHVALKIGSGLSEHRARRFEREAAVLAELDHPHIVKYLAHGSLGRSDYFLAMELLEGETLGARLQRGRLPLEDVLVLARTVASALAVAHALGIVHRDVKPCNIFLVGNAVAGAKLLDFGLARRFVEDLTLTSSNAFLGTPGYMAPEQIRGDVSDARADVFALGCVIYECLAGFPAFRADSLSGTLASVLLEEPRESLANRPHIPADLSSLVHRMLSKALVDRPADAGIVSRELVAISLAPSYDPESGDANRIRLDLVASNGSSADSTTLVMPGDAAIAAAPRARAPRSLAATLAISTAALLVALAALAMQSLPRHDASSGPAQGGGVTAAVTPPPMPASPPATERDELRPLAAEPDPPSKLPAVKSAAPHAPFHPPPRPSGRPPEAERPAPVRDKASVPLPNEPD
jgi:serine/threonine protein kinase